MSPLNSTLLLLIVSNRLSLKYFLQLSFFAVTTESPCYIIERRCFHLVVLQERLKSQNSEVSNDLHLILMQETPLLTVSRKGDQVWNLFNMSIYPHVSTCTPQIKIIQNAMTHRSSHKCGANFAEFVDYFFEHSLKILKNNVAPVRSFNLF